MVAPETPLGPAHSTPPSALDKPSLGVPPLLRLMACTLASKADRNAQEPSEMGRNAQELLTPTLPSEANFTLFLMKGSQENPVSAGVSHTHTCSPFPKRGSSLNETPWQVIRETERGSLPCAWRSRLGPPPSSFLALRSTHPERPRAFWTHQS